MWKSFNYKSKPRVAWVPQQGPAYQIHPEPGFRSFKPEKMADVTEVTGPVSIPEDVIKKYPELEPANETSISD